LASSADTQASDSFAFEPAGEDELDQKAPPENLVSIRDADASQSRCILAARDGHSFVMDGPPGSGKSQTISNIIAELLHAGKRVLFVSEKAAALEVVHSRLKSEEIDDFILELHSHKATRKAVAQELGAALRTRPSANATFSKADHRNLAKRRKELSAYARALNEVRQPLGE